MKWTKKGYQFDPIGKNFANNECLAIYGCGHNGEIAYKELLPFSCIDCFIDEDPVKQDQGYLGKQVFSLKEFIQKYGVQKTLVLITPNNDEAIMDVLLNLWGGVNIYKYAYFKKYYLSIYLLYKFGKLLLPELTVSVGDSCTLKCRHCSFDAHRKSGFESIEELADELDLLFANVDYISKLAVVGGEPLAYPLMGAYLELLNKYRKRVGEIRIVTNLNASIPSPLPGSLRVKDMAIEWTNYLDKISNTEICSKIVHNAELLKQEGVTVNEIRHSYWLDFGVTDNVVLRQTDHLPEFYDRCHSLCRVFKNDALIACYPGYCQRKFVPEKDNNRLSFLFESERKKHIIYEYYRWYTDSGYLDECRYCNGINGNAQHVSVAEQL